MATAGYSGTSLAKKLGLKNNFKIKLVNQPKYYFKLFVDLPPDMKVVKDAKTKKDFIHYFTKSAAQLKKDFKTLRNEIEQDGMIWISWPKKAAKIETDVDENLVRDTGLKNGLVDVKVCAVDEIWSGLKFMIRVKDRK
jgi:hypothetical protein